MKPTWLATWAGIGVVLLAGCGSTVPPKPTGIPLKKVVVDPGPVADEPSEPDVPDDPDETKDADASDEPVAKPAPVVGSGRPAIIMGPSSEISSTFGSTPASVLKLKAKGGNFTLKINEGALYTGTNIRFKLAGSGAKQKPPVNGTIVYLEPTIGDKRFPQQVKSGGATFEFRVPLAGRDDINLAVGTLAIGDEGEVGDITWVVHSPTRVEKGLGEAYFELMEIGPSYLYGTSAPPTAAE